jgi:flagellar protein FlaI
MLEKVKGLRGLFYRKVVEATEKKEEAILPGFSIKKTTRFVEFPEITDMTKVNITYPLMEPFTYINIKWDPETKELMYIVLEPKLTDEEKETLRKISDGLIELIEVELTAIKEPSKAIEYLVKNISKVIKEYNISLTQNQYVKLMYYIYRNFIGFNEIEPFLLDPNIEDISCDGTNTPIYIIHRKFGSLKTNVIFKDLDDLREFIIKLAERCGRYVSYAEPILTGTMPDGSRVSATLAGDVATRGPTFTLRKFGEKPFSPVDQMEVKTANSEALAYYWYLLEHGASMLIVGGVATGKTSFLNSLCMFIPPEAKIVSIEDTRELRIPHEHWIPGLARVGFGIPMPTGEKYGEVTMFDLLRESFRQNPDYVIVGEVRGNETYVMFQGMSSGHPCISTFHAGSIDTVVKRLTTPPIELSPTLLESLNIITIMVHAREKGKSARRIKEIVEVESVDPKTEEVNTNVIFKWNPITDVLEKVNESTILKRLVTAKGGTVEGALIEVERRKKILDWFKANGIKDFLEVTKMINLYYKEPKKLLQMMGEKLIIEKPMIEIKVPIKTEKKEERQKERVSILDLLGFKIIREK